MRRTVVHPLTGARANPRHVGAPGCRRTPAAPPLVQLLTPEGERVHHPDYDVDLTDERVPRVLPRPRPGTPDRRRGDCPAATGRAGHLGRAARPGGGAGRFRSGAAPAGLRLPDVPRARGRLVPRRRPADAARAVPRREQRRVGPAGEALQPLHDRHRLPDAARDRLRDGHRHGRRRRRRRDRRGGHRLLRRRRLQPGRRERGLRLGAASTTRRSCSSARTTSGASRRRPSTQSRIPLVPSAPRASASRACGSTATTCSPPTP